MARIRTLTPDDLPDELAAIQREYVAQYGPFANQAGVLAHVPAALRHLPTLLMELRQAGTLSRRHLELVIVTVSRLEACEYCIGHHKPFLRVEGLSDAGIDRLPEFHDHPELDDVDRLVVEYAIAAWRDSHRVPKRLFDALRTHFSEAQIVELTLRITLTGFFNRFSSALKIDPE